MILQVAGRKTSQGAYTETKVYAPDGKEVVPRREMSKSGTHWVDSFSLESAATYLLTTVDISNSGKNNSFTEVNGRGELSEIQKKIKEGFENEHYK